jgi:hypothetical protein
LCTHTRTHASPLSVNRIFIGFQWTLIGLQFIAQEIIEDCPAEVTIQRQRNEFINSKVVEKVADEEGAYREGVVGHTGSEEDLVEAGKGTPGPVHCGNVCCCRAPKDFTRVGTKRLTTDVEPYTQMQYPFAASARGWPQTLTSDNVRMTGAQRKAAAKAAAATPSYSPYNTSSYAGSIAALPGPPPPPAPGYV